MSDSRPDTYAHIHQVQKYLLRCIGELQQRALNHDQTKLHPPEVAIFDEFTPKLAECEYGSEEYKANLEAMKPALDHHYSHNSHHAQFYLDGIKGMNLLDLVEMLCDWQAATLRSANGDIHKSIDINQEKYGYSEELKQILINTVPFLQ